MRMTKRKKELLRIYQLERTRGFQAKWALSNARTRLEWDKHEVAEYSSGEAISPKRGNVRLRVVPDETCSLGDLEGDCFKLVRLAHFFRGGIIMLCHDFSFAAPGVSSARE